MTNDIEKTATTLRDKWSVDHCRIVISGSQAIARILLMQKALDARAGLRTAGYVTGYRGSPLGNVDSALWSAGKQLEASAIRFQPGLNEDIAATALRGTQQIEAVPDPSFDGVFAAWYAKGPGIDRSGDAIKHGNYAGSHRHGGVVIFYGDDHAAKSSTIAHASEAALAAHLVPSLYPANVEELLSFGQMAIALSRYSGSWIGIKCVNEVAEQTATTNHDIDSFHPVLPPRTSAQDINIRPRAPFNPLGEEQAVVEQRLPLVHAFVRANGLDRTIFSSAKPRLGIVAAGKSFGDVRAALDVLGLDHRSAAELGISLYKPGCIFPLEPKGIETFAAGHQTMLVVEEKRSFIEQQIASILINAQSRPVLIGKIDEDGLPLLSASLPGDPINLARVIADRLDRMGAMPESLREARDRLLGSMVPTTTGAVPRRAPFFCSGCPHNRSTKVPDGSVSMTGIGCHTMVNLVRPDKALAPTHMGGEGGNWIGLAPFTGTPHMFQNMGDGTYYHSGLLAIRAAVASGVNITYKILYNDAVAMTGGQPVDGPLSCGDIARQVLAEGVRRVVLLSDAPERHDGALPAGVKALHRNTLDEVQRQLRSVAGCTVLIYEQTCAAEKRRRRKRGSYPDPDKRMFIAKSVCESCGDCSVQSTCVSLVPVDTPFGPKRAIDQSSCNKDFSCVEGFCPSFVTVAGGGIRKPVAMFNDDAFAFQLDDPEVAPSARGFNMMIAGIGGTGVVTIGAIVGMAAHIEGKSASMFDMTGLSQKNGAVYSHVRIADTDDGLTTQRLSRGEADLVLAFDIVAALAPEAADTVQNGRTRIVANAAVAPTVAFQFDRDSVVDPATLVARLQGLVQAAAFEGCDASGIARRALGDQLGSNLILLGIAAQRGLLPIAISSIETAVKLNGVAIEANLKAFRLGRRLARDPSLVSRLLGESGVAGRREPRTLVELVEHRSNHLREYQDSKLADRFRAVVGRVRDREHDVVASDELSITVAKSYAKLLAYKDEYEVARLLTHESLEQELYATFAPGAKFRFNLAPPLLSNGSDKKGRPAKWEFGPWMKPILKGLAKARRLRGTWMDPFGRTAERRAERALIAQYEALTDRAVKELTSDNHRHWIELLSLPLAVRGYGPIKMESIERYQQQLTRHGVASISIG